MDETPPSRPIYDGPSVSIESEMKTSYLDYAMSVIVSRAIPDLRDGLKPVHRRILYAMHETNNTHDKSYRKSARPVGDVMGKYHPHGDSAIYDALVRMAQDFSMSLPLLDGQGNFGSMDGDNAAAMRYTEVRMDKPAAFLLTDIDKDTGCPRGQLVFTTMHIGLRGLAETTHKLIGMTSVIRGLGRGGIRSLTPNIKNIKKTTILRPLLP